MDLAPTISTQGLTRRFGELIAVDGIDLRVAPGQFLRLPRPQRRRQIHHHQNAHWSFSAQRGTN